MGGDVRGWGGGGAQLRIDLLFGPLCFQTPGYGGGPLMHVASVADHGAAISVILVREATSFCHTYLSEAQSLDARGCDGDVTGGGNGGTNESRPALRSVPRPSSWPRRWLLKHLAS
eukprot:5910657-Pyramimonas_sp.AAC.1